MEKPDDLPIFDAAEKAAEVGRELYDALKVLHRAATLEMGVSHPAVVEAGKALSRAREEV